MQRQTFAAIVFLLTILLAVTFRPTAARADYEWDDYLEWREEQAEEYEEQMEDRQEALEEYWEHQRERQRDFNHPRVQAWYGNYGPYYRARIAAGCANSYGPKQFYSSALSGSYYDCGQDIHCHGGTCYSNSCISNSYGPADCGPVDYGCHRDLRYPYGSRLAIGPLDDCWE